ncbi:MAG: helix-turn-helix domain-containing protein [Euryarchaeota archaeon]|nr:helix-turn-helix domain-containing protein [Euryarchaeota archaeon]
MSRESDTSDDLRKNVRNEIRKYIWEHPGAHLREIVRNLDIAIGQAQYHLDQMEKSGEVVSYKIGRYRRYFPPMFTIEKAMIVGFIRVSSARRLLEVLAKYGPGTLSELSERAGLKPQTAAFHLKMLEEYGIVEKGPDNKYKLKEKDFERIISVATSGTLDKLVSRFIEAFYK